MYFVGCYYASMKILISHFGAIVVRTDANVKCAHFPIKRNTVQGEPDWSCCRSSIFRGSKGQLLDDLSIVSIPWESHALDVLPIVMRRALGGMRQVSVQVRLRPRPPGCNMLAS